jgi:hypothetical protein
MLFGLNPRSAALQRGSRRAAGRTNVCAEVIDLLGAAHPTVAPRFLHRLGAFAGTSNRPTHRALTSGEGGLPLLPGQIPTTC